MKYGTIKLINPNSWLLKKTKKQTYRSYILARISLLNFLCFSINICEIKIGIKMCKINLINILLIGFKIKDYYFSQCA